MAKVQKGVNFGVKEMNAFSRLFILSLKYFSG